MQQRYLVRTSRTYPLAKTTASGSVDTIYVTAADVFTKKGGRNVGRQFSGIRHFHLVVNSCQPSGVVEDVVAGRHTRWNARTRAITSSNEDVTPSLNMAMGLGSHR
jgi:hypothetical protein